ncbi:hypothetical protein ES705_43323 [subsurface metagenome]
MASPLGFRTTQLYIDPKTTITIRDAIQDSDAAERPTPLGILQLMAHTPDMKTLYLRAGDAEEYADYADAHEDEFLLPPPDPFMHPAQYEFFLAETKTSALLLDWIEEVTEDQLVTDYKVGPGDIMRMVSSVEWLLHATAEIAALLKVPGVRKLAMELQTRVKHGCKRELLPLIRLPSIGRVRGRILFNAGYKTPEAILKAPMDKLVALPLIGPEIARKIKDYLGGTPDEQYALRLKPLEESSPSVPRQNTLLDFKEKPE